MTNKRIKDERLKLKLTQQELAEKLNISPGAIGMYEQGRRTPEVDILVKMANLFDCTVDYLLGRTDNKDEYIAIINAAKNAKIPADALAAYIDFLKNRK